MSFQEKRSLTSILSGVIMIAAYIIHVIGRVRAGTLAADEMRPWAITMLVFIAIGIGITIVIQILFHISLSISVAVQEKIRDQNCDDKDIEKSIKQEMVEDERDHLVSMKANQIGFGVAGGGFVAALLALVLQASPAVMLNIAFAAFWLGALIEGVAQIYYYRKGI